MLQGDYRIISHKEIAPGVKQLVLEGDTSAITAPGQFVNVQIEGFFLRRPISVCAWDEHTLTLIYKTVGKGTEKLASLQTGATLNLLTGLGNGYDTSLSGERPLLIGGGAGVPPLYGLAQRLLGEGKAVTVILGFNTASEIFYEERFRALGAEVIVTTVDGSAGRKGFVSDVMPKLAYTYFYTCGPMPMFRAIEKVASAQGQYSFEERMGCGFGACMGCSFMTKSGSRRVCKDGPVFERKELLW